MLPLSSILLIKSSYKLNVQDLFTFHGGSGLFAGWAVGGIPLWWLCNGTPSLSKKLAFRTFKGENPLLSNHINDL